MALPAANMPMRPGKTRVAAGLRLSSIWVAEKVTNSANNRLNVRAGRAEATCEPVNAPTRMPGANTMATGHNTAPRRWCARRDESEVKQMVASEVATAILTVCSAG